MQPDYITKVCSCCHLLKPLSEYYRHSGNLDGHQYWCKPCQTASVVAAHRAKPEKQRAVVLAHYHAKGYERVLERKYGLERGGYRHLLENQSGVCAICGGPPNGQGRFHVDHDHETGIVRGLLCYRCNAALGYLDEDPGRFAKALDYLLKSGAAG